MTGALRVLIPELNELEVDKRYVSEDTRERWKRVGAQVAALEGVLEEAEKVMGEVKQRVVKAEELEGVLKKLKAALDVV